MSLVIPVQWVVSHTWLHLDEFFALWLARRLGAQYFPGILSAPILCIDAGSLTYRGLTADQAEVRGILMLGVGQGRFDEHRPNGERLEGASCTSLMAQHLGLSQEPVLQRLLAYVNKNDGDGQSSEFDLAQLTAAANQDHDGNPLTVFNVLAPAFEAFYQSGRRFVAAREDINRSGSHYAIEEPTLLNGSRRYHLVLVHSDYQEVSSAAKAAIYAVSEYRNDPIVMVVRSSSGRTYVGAPRAPQATIDRIKQAITAAEPGAWHPMPKALLNGSPSAPNVPPSRLSLDAIRDMVAQAIAG